MLLLTLTVRAGDPDKMNVAKVILEHELHKLTGVHYHEKTECNPFLLFLVVYFSAGRDVGFCDVGRS